MTNHITVADCYTGNHPCPTNLVTNVVRDIADSLPANERLDALHRADAWASAAWLASACSDEWRAVKYGLRGAIDAHIFAL
jgi:hypothetical protein